MCNQWSQATYLSNLIALPDLMLKASIHSGRMRRSISDSQPRQRTHASERCNSLEALSGNATLNGAVSPTPSSQPPLRSQVSLLWARRQFARGNLRELDCQQVLTVSVHDLNLPMPSILALPISFEEALASTGECLVQSRRKVGQWEPHAIYFEHASISSDVEVVVSSSAG